MKLMKFKKTLRKASLLVAFYNIQDTVTENGRPLLLDLTCGLSEANADFRMEAIHNTKVAVVTFLKNIVVDTYLIKNLVFNERPTSVFSYYVSFNTALYGREEPLRKLQAPFLVDLDPLIRKNLAEKASPDWNDKL